VSSSSGLADIGAGGMPMAKQRKKAKRDEPKVAKTWGELAGELEISERVLQRLGTRADFPGRAGHPGKRDGHFPIETIRAWLGTIRSVPEMEDEDLLAVARRVKLLELEEKEAAAALRLEKLADVEEVGQYCEQVVNNAKAILGSLEDEVVALLPASIPAKVRVQVHRRTQQLRDTALKELARLSEGDTDDTSDPEAEG
jgi:hypothetical protein